MILNYTCFMRLKLLGRYTWFTVYANCRTLSAFNWAIKKLAVHVGLPAILGQTNHSPTIRWLACKYSINASFCSWGIKAFQHLKVTPVWMEFGIEFFCPASSLRNKQCLTSLGAATLLVMDAFNFLFEIFPNTSSNDRLRE